MIRRRETRLLPYAADLLYAVTADVERYPEFLPWCRRLRVLSRMAAGDGETLLAEMTVGFGAFVGSYVSRVGLDARARTIAVTQESGPFRHLENRWTFAPAAQGTLVDFAIAFEIRNPLVHAAVAGAFDLALREMAHAFERRAEALTERADGFAYTGLPRA